MKNDKNDFFSNGAKSNPFGFSAPLKEISRHFYKKSRGGTPTGERAPQSTLPHLVTMRIVGYASVGVPLPFFFRAS
jgi:hypothetical protein